MGVQIAKAMGMRVVGVDGGDAKRDLCMKLGCEAFVDFTKVKSVEEEVVKICDGKGAHGVFVTATSASAYASAPMMTRISGKVMCVGLREFFFPGLYERRLTWHSPYWNSYCWS
jgi:propanol-preferring alcohol dehydrogenase